MKLYYLQNETRKCELNKAGVDYTPAYIPAILVWLGADGTACTPADLPSLTEQDVLLANLDDLDTIPENVGHVILLGGSAVAREAVIHGHVLFGEERIPLFAPIARTAHAQEVLYMGEDADGEAVPAVVRQDDRTYAFCFDLCATVWFAGDGFSDGKGKNGFFIGRTPDTRPVPHGMYSDRPYNDHLLTILEDILLSLGVPMVSRLPLTEEGVLPDFALHISGDDDYTSADFNLNAARITNSLGLPYHENAMPGGDQFIITREQMEEMAALGCELALHTDYLKTPYTEEGQKASADLYRKYFGVEPITNVNHCLIQAGMAAERLRWLAASGIIADNGKLGEIDPSNINAFNLCGFGFGTSFPRYTCDDAEHENQLISCMEIPLNYYEPRIGGQYTDEGKVLNYIDGAAEDGRIAQFFVHPHYFNPANANSEWSVAALKAAIAHWKEKGYTPCLTSTNRIARFWEARKDVQIAVEDDRYSVNNALPMALALPNSVVSVTVDGADAAVITRTVTGRERKYVVLANAGAHIITVNK